MNIEERLQAELDIIEEKLPEGTHPVDLFMEAIFSFTERNEHELIAYITRKSLAKTKFMLDNMTDENDIKTIKGLRERLRGLQKVAVGMISKEEQEQAMIKDCNED